MSTEPVKILVISLMSSKKYKAHAVYDGEQLVIASMSPIVGMFNSWRDGLIKEIEECKSKGWIVIVEERTDFVSSHATQYLLEDMNDENRSNYFDALDWYFALQDMENLIIHPDYQQYQIRTGGEGQKVEKKQDEKGRPIYAVDWKSFHGGFRCVLLCVVAAMYEPISGRFLDAMWGKTQEEDEIENPVKRWKRIFQAQALGKEAYLMEERGQR